MLLTMTQSSKGVHLKIGAILISVCEFLISMTALIASTGGLIYFEHNQNEILETFVAPPENFRCLQNFINFDNLGNMSVRIFLGFSMTYWLQRVVLAVFLFRSVIKEERTHCQVWIVYSIILLTCSAVAFMTAMLFGLLSLMSIPVYVGLFCVREYSICVISSLEKRFSGSTYEKSVGAW